MTAVRPIIVRETGHVHLSNLEPLSRHVRSLALRLNRGVTMSMMKENSRIKSFKNKGRDQEVGFDDESLVIFTVFLQERRRRRTDEVVELRKVRLSILRPFFA